MSQGILDGADLAMVRRKVAVKMGVQVRELEEIARRLSEVCLIDQNTLLPQHWRSRQFMSDADPTAAERQRRRREKINENNVRNSVTRDSRVSHANVTPTDTDTDTDTDTEETQKNSIVRLARTHSRFEEFWNVWPKSPRKRNKADCQKIWTRKRLDAMADVIIADVARRSMHDQQWTGGYEPMPATYLNKQTWEDGFTGTESNAAGAFRGGI
jgi:hypothetical protein